MARRRHEIAADFSLLAHFSALSYQDRAQETSNGISLDVEASNSNICPKLSAKIETIVDAESQKNRDVVSVAATICFVAKPIVLRLYCRRTVFAVSVARLYFVLARFSLTQCLYYFCE